MKAMDKNFPLLLIFFFGIITYGCGQKPQKKPESTKDYLTRIKKERMVKDTFMQTDKESPFVITKTTFHSLNYFPVDTNFKVKASLEKLGGTDIISMETSDGEAKRFSKYARATFKIGDTTCHLTLYQAFGPERNILFMPFTDETSAESTYGAGRYLDFNLPVGDSLVLDFNEAYNPYCAYTEGYSCPIPPKENHLPVSITAGEKNYDFSDPH